ncbi:MAG: OB-fold domain-containing protein [Desulfitobacteriaceae bacterium]
MPNETVAIKDGLFTWPDPDPTLLVSKCTDCGTAAFPTQDYCPKCCNSNVETVRLNKRGRLHTFTSIRNQSPESKIAVPYGVGIVEFPEKIRIMGLLTTEKVEKLSHGMEMETVIEPLYSEDGKDVVSYRFRPIE